MDRRASSLLSLAMKAGKLSAGETACEKALQMGNAELIIISSEASSNTRKKFTNKAFYYGVNVVVCGTMEEISRPIGKSIRAVISINDKNFAGKINEMLQELVQDNTDLI